jgi:hypothetical protein
VRPRILASGAVLLGALAQLLLYREAVGLNVPSLAAATLAAGALAARSAPARADLWIPFAALAFAGVLSGLLVAAGANLIAPAQLSARANVDRFLAPELVPADGVRGLDAYYLLSLGDAAIPDLIRALPRLDARTQADAACWLAVNDRGSFPSSLASWNYERESARVALASVELPPCPRLPRR